MLSRITVLEKKDRKLMAKIVNCKPYKFDNTQKKWERVETFQQIEKNPNSIRILSYNVLFDDHQADEIYSEEVLSGCLI